MFPTPSGAPVHTSNFYKRVWRPTLTAAGLPQTWHLRDLRKAYASSLVRSGRSMSFFTAVMGHASARTTMKYYAGVFPEETLSAVRDLEEWYSPLRTSRVAEQPEAGSASQPLCTTTAQRDIGSVNEEGR